MLWGRALMARLDGHVRRHGGAYVFLVVVFALGLALGALAARLLPAGERQALWQAAAPLGSAFHPSGALWWRAIEAEVGVVGLLWALGASVVGLPAAVAIIGLRGMAAGFACAFLVEALGPAGLAMAGAGVVLPALFVVPAWLFVVVAGLDYGGRVAASVLRGEPARATRREDPLGRLTACALGAGAAGVAGAVVSVAAAAPAAHLVVTAWHLSP